MQIVTISLCCVIPFAFLLGMMGFNMFVWEQSWYWSHPERLGTNNVD